MKTKFVSLIIFMSLLLAACSSAAAAATQETDIPPVIADGGITAEGRVEPLRFAEIAFTTSGVTRQA